MKFSPRFGIITGFAVGIWNITCFTIVGWFNNFFSLGIPAERLRAYSGLLGIIILITGINFGIKAAKRNNGNAIGFAQAAKTGVFISIITAVMVAFFAWLYCTAINPGYTAYMVEQSRTALLASGKKAIEIGPELERVRSQFSTSSQVMQALIAQSVTGSISSVIIAFFNRTKKTS
jgi:hypothetical protein